LARRIGFFALMFGYITLCEHTWQDHNDLHHPLSALRVCTSRAILSPDTSSEGMP
jgi:hypothetical protein